MKSLVPFDSHRSRRLRGLRLAAVPMLVAVISASPAAGHRGSPVAPAAGPVVLAPGPAPPGSPTSLQAGLQADTLDLAAYRGRVVYLDFWASWCKPCRSSFPWMNDLTARLAGQGLAVVTVSLDKKKEAAVTFLQEFSPAFPVYHDPEGKLALRHGLKAMPTSCLYGRDGTLRATHTGFSKETAADIEKEILDLLKEEAPHGGTPPPARQAG